ncbi:condensation domain-containing protein [Paenibacillus sp. NPDC057934]|uniref:condensation domain-containing protein n=1 Tax=Paenibacillus sp. NPDC057934 TaxID=3346282 RepID=UPI0036DCD08B
MVINSENEIKGVYPLTPLQEGMLYHHMTDGESNEYIMQYVFNLAGIVIEEHLIQALRLLTIRHEVLKTAFIHEKLASPRQIVVGSREVEYEQIDLLELHEIDQNAKLAEISELDVKRGFDIQNDSLLRVKYIILSNENRKMIWDFHHLIIDSWCLSLLINDFKRYYNSLNNGKTKKQLLELITEEKSQAAGYGDYIQWLDQQDKKAGLSYWKKLLVDYDETAEIKPLTQPEQTTVQMVKQSIRITEKATSGLQDLFPIRVA